MWQKIKLQVSRNSFPEIQLPFCHIVLYCCCPELSPDIHQVRNMSHVRNGVLQVRQVMEQLVHQNRQSMELIEKQRSLIRGSE